MPESTSQAGNRPAAGDPAGDGNAAAGYPRGSRDLPQYTRSLLRIQVPVLVTLAQKRQPLGRIVELSPGAILQFDKSCEEMLELFVGDRPIACGEAVKVGDKFGLRVTSITPPDERYYPLGTL
ncbi:MAG: FliM/FliN family flagellar motor C-terminal domain-containing protein [Thermoguttaceae bacterium]|jgi:flagellar motor switch/type III secretory pathway protein FliN